jgi:hypothetical protein
MSAIRLVFGAALLLDFSEKASIISFRLSC